MVLKDQTFQPRGHSYLEIADLYSHDTNSFLRLKNIMSAVSLAQLLDQTVASIELLNSDDDKAWEFLMARVKTKWPDASIEEIERRLGVIIALHDVKLDELPIFAKLAVRRAVRQLQKMKCACFVAQL
jgi:uncharacterized protein (TIGR04141 family)